MENGLLKNNWPRKLLLARPRGFCAGVKRAIEALNQILLNYPNQPIYCYHQIVHNTHVVKDFEDKGVKFVNNIDSVPRNSILVFSSHGVSPEIKLQASNLNLQTIDATCPFVAKTHLEVKKFADENYQVIYIGQPKHDEAVGTTGEAPDKTMIIQTTEEAQHLNFPRLTKLVLVTQTTLSYDETAKIKQILQQKFPQMIEPGKSDICLATQNRQNGVKQLVKKGAKIVIVLGSPNSSNSNKLKKVAEESGAKACLVDEISEIDPQILINITCIGLTAGASLPENKITEAINWFKEKGTTQVREIVVADESQIAISPVQFTVNY